MGGFLRRCLIGLWFVLAALAAAAQEGAPLNATPDGIAMDGFDVVAYQAQGAPAQGLAEHAVTHAGATWLFASAANAAAFAADPARYAPRHNGWCSYAVSEGYGAEVDFVDGWAVIDGVLYLNWDRDTRDLFVAEQARRVPAAAANWPGVAAGLADGTADFYRHADDPAVGISHPQRLP
jgi:YHS domain-containing protein